MRYNDSIDKAIDSIKKASADIKSLDNSMSVKDMCRARFHVEQLQYLANQFSLKTESIAGSEYYEAVAYAERLLDQAAQNDAVANPVGFHANLPE